MSALDFKRKCLEHDPAVQDVGIWRCPVFAPGKEVELFTCSTIWYKYPFCGSRSNLQALEWLHPSLGLSPYLLHLYTAGGHTGSIPFAVICYHKTMVLFHPLCLQVGPFGVFFFQYILHIFSAVAERSSLSPRHQKSSRYWWVCYLPVMKNTREVLSPGAKKRKKHLCLHGQLPQCLFLMVTAQSRWQLSRQAQGFICLFRTECEMQSLLLVGGRLLLLNFLITFSTAANFPFDVVLLSLVLVQGEYLISHGELEGFILPLFLSTFITLTTDKELLVREIKQVVLGQSKWVCPCLAVKMN